MHNVCVCVCVYACVSCATVVRRARAESQLACGWIRLVVCGQINLNASKLTNVHPPANQHTTHHARIHPNTSIIGSHAQIHSHIYLHIHPKNGGDCVCACVRVSVNTARNQFMRVGCQFRHVKRRGHLPIERDGLLFHCVRVSDVAEDERIERKGFAVGEHLLELASAL